MRRKAGIGLLILGALLVLASAALLLYNRREDACAGRAADEVMAVMDAALSKGETAVSEKDPGMNTVDIDGHLYIGYLTLPTLDLQLPVMETWTYANLRTAPCRYAGACETEDLVIAGHNYARHFGRLSALSPGHAVYFTSVDGTTCRYKVASVEELAPYEVAAMTESGYALTLFTCTYSGRKRTVVRCVKAS